MKNKTLFVLLAVIVFVATGLKHHGRLRYIERKDQKKMLTASQMTNIRRLTSNGGHSSSSSSSGDSNSDSDERVATIVRMMGTLALTGTYYRIAAYAKHLTNFSSLGNSDSVIAIRRDSSSKDTEDSTTGSDSSKESSSSGSTDDSDSDSGR